VADDEGHDRTGFHRAGPARLDAASAQGDGECARAARIDAAADAAWTGATLNRRDVIVRMGAALSAAAAAGRPLPAAAQASEKVATGGDALLTAEEQAWVDQHPVVLYAPELDFPPFSFIDSQGQHRGFSADVLDLLQTHTGLKFQPVAPGARAANLDRARRREVDLITSVRPTIEREQYLGFTSAYVSSPAVILRRRGDRRSGDLDKMGGERVAVEHGSSLESFLTNTQPSLQLAPRDFAGQGLRELVFGEVDACAINLATASFIIERDRLGGLRVAGETGYFSTLALGYRKDWPMLGRVLEKGLAQISETERATVTARWIPLTGIAWWQRPEVQRVLGVASIATGVLMGGLLLWNRALRKAVAQRTEALQKELAERQRLEQRLRNLAEHDALTGLMNRAAVTEALRRSLSLAARQKWSVAVVFVDLDRFKEVNDTLGHAAGDDLLRQISVRLLGCLRESDLLGRLGGDEFIVVAEALQDAPRNAIEFTEKLLAQMKQPFEIAGRRIDAGFSAGVAIYPGDGETPEALIANADSAMYRAKQGGRYRAALFRDGQPEPAAVDAGEAS
jgi:diguanylate cyclase (GGDEF)-like protein